MKIVLYKPQIPQNAGNVVRTCAVAGFDLGMVRPLGFSTTNRWLKRAGLDYWEGVKVSFLEEQENWLDSAPSRVYFFSSKAVKFYTEVSYGPTDWLVFGSETDGLPREFWENWPEKFVKIPMRPEKRCLNLATSVGIAAYEAWRQNGFS